MGVVTGCSPAVWAPDQGFLCRALSVLSGGDDAGEDEAKATQKPPVARCSGQEQIHVVQENDQKADDAEGDHHNREPGRAWSMNRAGARGVAGRGRWALVGGVCRLLGRSTLWGDAAASSTRGCGALVGSHSDPSVAVEEKLVRRDRSRPIGSSGDGRPHPCPR